MADADALWGWVVIASVITLAAAMLTTVDYQCVVDPSTTAVRVLGKNAKSNDLKFDNMPSGGWRFDVKLSSGDEPQAEISWPTEPIQIDAKFPAYVTGAKSFAVVASRKPPCMFTDGMCLSLIHIVDQSDQDAFVSVTAAGLSTDDSGQRYVPFVPIMHGTCTRKAGA
jgi:hypothetical protein